MSSQTDAGSRRSFLTDVGRLASSVAVAGRAAPFAASTVSAQTVSPTGSEDRWAYAVPSGIFEIARSRNAGFACIRL